MNGWTKAALFFPLLALAAGCGSLSGPRVAPDDALKQLMDGNERFAAGRPAHPDQGAERRKVVAEGQTPVAAVLACADSRVPPEILFDQGLGQLFVVRVAGNSAGGAALGSLEYAAKHLGVGLVVVLGHERCGAVEAAVKGGEAEGHVGSLLKPLQPAVARAKALPGDPVENAVQANVRLVVEELRASQPILADLVRRGRLRVVGARYDLDTARVTLLRS